MKSGPGEWTAWTTKDTSPADGRLYQQSVPLVQGHLAHVEFRARYTLNGATRYAHSLSAGMDFGAVALVTGMVPEFVGDQLWVTIYGDSDVRTSGGESFIGVVGQSFPGLSLAQHDFAINNARSGRVFTGTSIPNPGPGQTLPTVIWVRAVNEAGELGEMASVVATRIGSVSGGGGTIDTFSASKVQGGTDCLDPAQVSIDYDVNGADGSDTVTIERWVDGALDATIRSNSSTHDDTFTDDLPFHEDPPNLTPTHSVQYHIIVKTSGGTAYADAWSGTINFVGVVDC